MAPVWVLAEGAGDNSLGFVWLAPLFQLPLAAPTPRPCLL